MKFATNAILTSEMLKCCRWGRDESIDSRLDEIWRQEVTTFLQIWHLGTTHNPNIAFYGSTSCFTNRKCLFSIYSPESHWNLPLQPRSTSFFDPCSKNYFKFPAVLPSCSPIGRKSAEANAIVCLTFVQVNLSSLSLALIENHVPVGNACCISTYSINGAGRAVRIF